MFLCLMFCVTCLAQEQPVSPKTIRVLLDTDANNELDDQHAIAYLLLSGDVFEVEGLTVNRTSNGGDIHEQAAEAERVVRLCGLHPQLKVLKGASASFDEIRDHTDGEDFDGAEAVNHIIERAHARSEQKLVLMPVGKLTNIALAIKKDPSIIPKIRVVWLGSNYPAPGEYNQINDETSLSYLLESDVELEIVTVRYTEQSGTTAVRATREEIVENMAGKGPKSPEPVAGRHGGEFNTFGDYSVDLFERCVLYGDPPARPLFDMAAVAIVKNPAWAQPTTIPAPTLVDSEWRERPKNPRKIIIWEHFDRDAIIADFFDTMTNFKIARITSSH
jgi:hypothetical protein